MAVDEEMIEIPLKRRTQREKLAYFQGYHAAIDKNIPLHFTREMVDDGIVTAYRDGDCLVIKVRDKTIVTLDARVVELIKPLLQTNSKTKTKPSDKLE